MKSSRTKFLRTLLCRALKKTGRIFEDRIFYAIFQVTRVTNDHYGWRPPEDS
jgi:hypothetical protein